MGFEAKFDGRSVRNIPELLIMDRNPKQILRANRFNKLLVTGGPTDLLAELVRFPERINLQMQVFDTNNSHFGCCVCVEGQKPQIFSNSGTWEEILGLPGARGRWLDDNNVVDSPRIGRGTSSM